MSDFRRVPEVMTDADKTRYTAINDSSSTLNYSCNNNFPDACSITLNVLWIVGNCLSIGVSMYKLMLAKSRPAKWSLIRHKLKILLMLSSENLFAHLAMFAFQMIKQQQVKPGWSSVFPLVHNYLMLFSFYHVSMAFYVWEKRYWDWEESKRFSRDIRRIERRDMLIGGLVLLFAYLAPIMPFAILNSTPDKDKDKDKLDSSTDTQILYSSTETNILQYVAVYKLSCIACFALLVGLRLIMNNVAVSSTGVTCRLQVTLTGCQMRCGMEMSQEGGNIGVIKKLFRILHLQVDNARFAVPRIFLLQMAAQSLDLLLPVQAARFLAVILHVLRFMGTGLLEYLLIKQAMQASGTRTPSDLPENPEQASPSELEPIRSAELQVPAILDGTC